MTGNTRLLVFGVTHLGRGAGPEPDEALAEVVERIVRWRPDAIAIEVLPGELIDSYLRLGGPYADLRVGGLPQAVACAEAVASIQDESLWQARTVGADRSRPLAERITAWCAAYEPYTALLLAHCEPAAVDVAEPVREALDAVAARGSECWRIAGAAALRLGLDRLHPFDDHSNAALLADVPDGDYADLMASLAGSAQPYVAATESEVDSALHDGNLWPPWQRLSTPERVAASEELESGLFHTAGTPLARRLLAGWRARNLLMAGRLRSVTGEYPGGRVLALVGHAHKGPLEAALRSGQCDLDLADAAEL